MILPLGFKANGVSCGIKKSGKPDLALFFSEVPAVTSCMFTSNKVVAAPVKVNRLYLKKSRKFQAIIVNSGNANAFTGRQGFNDALMMVRAVVRSLCLKKESVLVASTGIIAKTMPIDKIIKALPGLSAGLSAGRIKQAKKAIMTTDKLDKEISAKFKIGGRLVTICGIAKGAGMIAPDLATMLSFIFTDANISRQALETSLKNAVNASFNCITVDGCMSTNDTVIAMANGLAGNQPITKNNAVFQSALNAVCLHLAKMMVKDGEGASKFISITVRGAKTSPAAKKIALAIANSNLFKTAMYAASPNIIGRIIAASGAAGVDFKEDALKIKYSPLAKKEVDVDVCVGKGKACALIYTSDLTHEYIKINAEYN